MNTRNDKKIQFSEYATHFSTQISNSDNLRDESLQRLRKIRGSRQKHQQRQLGRLTLKFGENHERVIRQADRIVREKEVVTFLDIAVDKTVIDTDSLKESYILKGKVRGKTRKGLSAYTVQLTDARNNVVGKPVKTDSDGNYSYIVDIEEGEKLRKLHIVVLDKLGTRVHTDTLPVSLKADVVDTRDLVIAEPDNIIIRRGKVTARTLKAKKPSTSPKKKIAKKATRKVAARKPARKSPK